MRHIKDTKNSPLIIGASGFVASEILRLGRSYYSQYTPSSQTLDITNPTKVDNYLSRHPSEVVVNFAAYTDVKAAEKQRDKRLDIAWRLNVDGAKNLARAARKSNKFLIQISTDSVFPTGLKTHGPYRENELPARNSRQTTWYGYTKLMGEKAIQETIYKFAIVRIIYPLSKVQNPKDYMYKLIQTMKNGYPLFSDQVLTPTYIPDLHRTLNVLISTRQKGIYHVATHPSTTPYQLGCVIAKLTNIGSPQKDFLREYLKSGNGIGSYALFGGLSTTETEKRLGLKFHNWKKALYEALKDPTAT